jgi:hypothetical protein
VRFELTDKHKPVNGFQDRRFKPLSHPSRLSSARELSTISARNKISVPSVPSVATIIATEITEILFVVASFTILEAQRNRGAVAKWQTQET